MKNMKTEQLKLDLSLYVIYTLPGILVRKGTTLDLSINESFTSSQNRI